MIWHRKKMLNEGNQIHNFILCLWELLWFHVITVPVSLRSVIKLRYRFRYGKKVTVPVPVSQRWFSPAWSSDLRRTWSVPVSFDADLNKDKFTYTTSTQHTVKERNQKSVILVLGNIIGTSSKVTLVQGQNHNYGGSNTRGNRRLFSQNRYSTACVRKTGFRSLMKRT
jgi:hypothetical protein